MRKRWQRRSNKKTVRNKKIGGKAIQNSSGESENKDQKREGQGADAQQRNRTINVVSSRRQGGERSEVNPKVNLQQTPIGGNTPPPPAAPACTNIPFVTHDSLKRAQGGVLVQEGGRVTRDTLLRRRHWWHFDQSPHTTPPPLVERAVALGVACTPVLAGLSDDPSLGESSHKGPTAAWGAYHIPKIAAGEPHRLNIPDTEGEGLDRSWFLPPAEPTEPRPRRFSWMGIRGQGRRIACPFIL